MFIYGVGVTVLLAMGAKMLAQIPYLSMMGSLVLAMLLGMGWRASVGVGEGMMRGVSFSGKSLLRLGIILLGMRLNLADIVHAGWGMFAIAVINLVFALGAVYVLTRWMGVERTLGILTACGTAICGAAAVVALAPQLRAKDEETAVAAATVAVLGTIFTVAYTLLYPVLGLSAAGYGVLSGSTLHEVAHAIAAAGAGGNEAVDIAVMVKLTRVAMLVPVALVLGYMMRRGERVKQGTGDEPTEAAGRNKRSTFAIVPWFIVGFVAMSGVNTLGLVPESAAGMLVNAAYLLIGMAMAGLGLNVELKTFRRMGSGAFLAGLVGSVLLSGVGYGLVCLWV
nr:putative sulfate exporter family transporter [Paenibacillus swuensis]